MTKRLEKYRDPKLVRAHLERNETNTVLLVTEKRPPSAGRTQWEEFIHCRVVGPQPAAVWSVAEVNSAIAMCNPLTIPDADLGQWSAYFCVFFLGAAPSIIHAN